LKTLDIVQNIWAPLGKLLAHLVSQAGYGPGSVVSITVHTDTTPTSPLQALISNFTPQVKEARNQSQILNRKSISRNTTHRQSYHLQAMLTGVKRRKAKTRSEKVNNLKTAMKKNAQTQPRQIKQHVLLNYMHKLKPQNLLHK